MTDVFDFNTAKPLQRDVPPAPGCLEAANGNEATARTNVGPRALPDFTPRHSRFKVEWFDKIQPSREAAVVKGLWPATGVCFVYGPSMSGKSFFMLDAAARVSRGLPVVGRKSRACGVLYIASEDGGGVRARIAGLRQQIGELGQAFAFIGQPPDLTDPDESVPDLRATIEEVRAEMYAAGVRLGMIVLDTFSTSAPGADENSAKDMSPVLTRLHSIAREMGLLVVVVHHSGKDADRGMRGWSGFLANADGVIALEAPDRDGVRCGKVVKVKNGEAGWRFAFTLEKVVLGTDDDGDPIETCVVASADVSEGGSASRPRLTNRQAIMLRAIKICLDNGEAVAMPGGPGIPPNAKGVPRQAAKDRALREGFGGEDGTPGALRKALNDAIAGLIAKGLIRQETQYLMLM